MYEVTEGLLIAVLGVHLVVLFFIAWQILHFGQYIRQVRRLVMAIAGMDCDKLIDELMSVGAGAGLAEGAPLAAALARGTAARQTRQRATRKKGCKNTMIGSRPSLRGGGGQSRAVWTGGPWESIHR